MNKRYFFSKPSPEVTNNPKVGDVVIEDPPAEKKSYSFRREWLKDFEWLRYADVLRNVQCTVQCTALTVKPVGQSLQVTQRSQLDLYILSARAWLHTERVPSTKNAGTSVWQANQVPVCGKQTSF